jgi:hypothetical protein
MLNSSLTAFSTALFLSISLLQGGCVSSIEPGVDITPSPSEDHDYYTAYSKATKTRAVFKDFESRMTITATYLSPEFRSAFGQRLERVYKKGETRFGEANDKAGFFVSVQAPEEDRTDLSNPQHWNLLLETGSGTVKPILIKKLDDKERWRAFFDAVTEWTCEYLIVFDVPSVTPNSPDLVAKTSVKVIFANADAQVNLIW